MGLNMQPLSSEFLCRDVGVVSAMNQSLSQPAKAMVNLLQQFYL